MIKGYISINCEEGANFFRFYSVLGGASAISEKTDALKSIKLEGWDMSLNPPMDEENLSEYCDSKFEAANLEAVQALREIIKVVSKKSLSHFGLAFCLDGTPEGCESFKYFDGEERHFLYKGKEGVTISHLKSTYADIYGEEESPEDIANIFENASPEIKKFLEYVLEDLENENI